MLLNCDLGESYGDRVIGSDADIMPHTDQANIACGFHGGDPATMQRTLELALEHDVQIGAHPSYPDREGFGRRSMDLAATELITALHYQVNTLEGAAKTLGAEVAYIKPHGALYNDMMAKPAVRAAVIQALRTYPRSLPLMLQATPRWQEHAEELKDAGIEPIFEAFADRRYKADGSLMPRSEAGAVLGSDAILQQAEQLATTGSVSSADGAHISLHAQTLCVHGDNPAALSAVAAIHRLLRSA